MVAHIYGKVNLLLNVNRPNMFINELNLYVDYLKKYIETNLQSLTDKKAKYFTRFKEQMEKGIQYYKELIPKISNQTESYRLKMLEELKDLENRLSEIVNRSLSSTPTSSKNPTFFTLRIPLMPQSFVPVRHYASTTN